MKPLRDGLISALLLAAIFAALALGYFALTAASTAAASRPVIESTGAQVYALSFQALRVEKKLYQTSEEQRLYWKVISHDTARTIEAANKTLLDLDHMVINADRNLNATLSVVGDTANATQQLTTHVDAEIVPVLRNAAEALGNVARITGDPNVGKSTRELAATMTDLRVTMENVQQMSEDTKQAVHRATRPATFTLRIGQLILDNGAKVANWLTGFAK